jgi:hypothetical protein
VTHAELVLGPLLRHTDTTSATVWVETTAPCEVSVLGTSAPTFEVCGHHYALVVLRGLEPGTNTPYEVALDGRTVWPEPGSPFPPSRVRTVPVDADSFRLVFGSCRKPRQDGDQGRDALAALAERMAGAPDHTWPQALLLLGDQVYADETTEQTRQWIAARRDVRKPPGAEVTDFEEYAHLYLETWSDPAVRWLMSTVPVSMIFDDHDVRDDWNTSDVWRSQMRRKPWWAERLRGAFLSYWVYQHLGNLGPAELDEDKTVAAVLGGPGDRAPLLRELAEVADNELNGAKEARWSYVRQFGRVRLLVIDTRAGRILAADSRSMLDEDEFRWVEENAAVEADHLLLGSSLPWLLPPAIAHVESINEAACRRPGWRGRLAEVLRQAADLEHWAAFRTSFDRLARLVARVGDAQQPPATVCVLSGDVHHSYIARARFPRRLASAVYQITCSPLHNAAPRAMQGAFSAGWWSLPLRLTRWWARRAGVTPLPVDWQRSAGPYFGNAVTTLELRGRHAEAVIEQPTPRGLVQLCRTRLTE